jgi:hypothetical protein
VGGKVTDGKASSYRFINVIELYDTGALSTGGEGDELSRDVGPLIDKNAGAGFRPALLKMC